MCQSAEVSGRPLRPREEEWKTPGNRQEQRCNLDKAGTEWFLFNSKGKPGPEDIMPSTDPKCMSHAVKKLGPGVFKSDLRLIVQ